MSNSCDREVWKEGARAGASRFRDEPAWTRCSISPGMPTSSRRATRSPGSGFPARRRSRPSTTSSTWGWCASSPTRGPGASTARAGPRAGSSCALMPRWSSGWMPARATSSPPLPTCAVAPRAPDRRLSAVRTTPPPVDGALIVDAIDAALAEAGHDARRRAVGVRWRPGTGRPDGPLAGASGRLLGADEPGPRRAALVLGRRSSGSRTTPCSPRWPSMRGGRRWGCGTR